MGIFININPGAAYLKNHCCFKFIRLSFLIAAILFFSNSFNIKAQTVFYGDSSTMGGGKVQSWVEVDGSNNPIRLGLKISKSILSKINNSYSEVSVNFPKIAGDSLFNHILINWNPTGHPPNNVYGLPHFDIHFYIISDEERKQIRGGLDKVTVPAMFLPQDYGFIPQEEYVSVPEMGVHYVDIQSPELHGQTFTRTLIYGFYKGKLIFIEPMITKDYLSTVTNEIIPYKQPQAYQRPGFYPAAYEVNYNDADQTIDIILKDVVYHAAVTSVNNPGDLPKSFQLMQNYPNPFNPSTNIKFDLPQTEFVTLKLFDALGNEIQSIINEVKPAGNYVITWKASDVSSGIYFYQLKAGNFIQTRKMLLLK